MTITGLVEEPDGHGGHTESTQVIAHRISANVVPLTGRALERAQQIDPRTTHQVELRYRRGLKTGQTAIFHDPSRGDRPMEIVAPPIDVEERRREMHVLCKEQEADQP